MTFAVFHKRRSDETARVNEDDQIAIRTDEISAIVAGERDGATIYLKSRQGAAPLGVCEDVTTVLRLLNGEGDTYTPTAKERRAIERGRVEMARGEYVTLDELRDKGKV